MARSTTPNFTRTDLREIADRAKDAHENALADDERLYAEAVEDTIRTLLGDARPTPSLTLATQGALI